MTLSRQYPPAGETELREERDAKARKAIKAARKLVPQWQAFARVLSRNPKVRIILTANKTATDGKDKIFLRVPAQLGEDMTHEKALCGRRGHGAIQRCYACAVLEEVNVDVIHEVAHRVFDTFTDMSDTEKADAIVRAVNVECAKNPHSKRAKALRERVEYVAREAGDYFRVGSAISPFMNMLINQCEDMRVNTAMGRARPGTVTMFTASYNQMLDKGVMTLDGEIHQYRDMGRNFQISMAIFCRVSGYDYAEHFQEDVVEAMDDGELGRIMDRIAHAEGIQGIYNESFPLLERCRELGFFLTPDDPEEDEPEPEPEASDDTEEEQPDEGQPEDSEEPTPDAEGEEDSDDGSDDVADEADPAGSDGEPDGSDAADDESPDADGGEPDSDDAEGDGDSPDVGDDADSGESDADGEDPAPDSDGADDPDGSSDGNSDADESDASGDDPAEAGDAPADVEPEGSTPSDGGADGSGEDDVPDSGDDNEAGNTDGGGDEAGDDAGPDGSGSDDAPVSPEVPGDVPSDGTPGDEGDPPTDGSGGVPGDTPSESGGSPDSPGDTPEGLSDPVFTGDQTDVSDTPGTAAPADQGTETGDPGPTPGPAGSDQPGTPGGRPTGPISQEQYEKDGTAEAVSAFLQQFTGHADDEPPSPEQDDDGDDGEAGEPGDKGDAQGMDDTPVFMPANDDGDDEPSEAEMQMMEQAMAIAMMQMDHFDGPSQNVNGLEIVRHDSGEHAFGAEDSWYYRDREEEEPIVVPESILSPALSALRLLFTDNRKRKNERNRKSGKIDTRALGKRAPVGDDRLFKKRHLPGKKDYFVILGCDVSGSTYSGDRLPMIKMATIAMAELLSRLGIPFAVYAHSGAWSDVTDGTIVTIMECKAPEEAWGDKQREAVNALKPYSANIDGHTLEFYRKVAQKSRATNRMILYFTDGAMPAENYDEELEILQREIETCRTNEIDLVGIGIYTDAPTEHGLETIQLDSMEEVPRVVTELQKKLSS